MLRTRHQLGELAKLPSKHQLQTLVLQDNVFVQGVGDTIYRGLQVSSVVLYSLIPRPSPAPAFDCILQAIKNWRRGRPGNEGSSLHVPQHSPEDASCRRVPRRRAPSTPRYHSFPRLSSSILH